MKNEEWKELNITRTKAQAHVKYVRNRKNKKLTEAGLPGEWLSCITCPKSFIGAKHRDAVIARLQETMEDSDVDNMFDSDEGIEEEPVLTQRETIVDAYDKKELSESVSSTTTKSMKLIKEEATQAQKLRRSAIQTKAEEKRALVSINLERFF